MPSVDSEIGPLSGYAYITPFDQVHHMAFVYGRIGDGRNIPVRVHRADVIGDVFGGAKPIHAALARFKKEGRGVLVFLRDGTAGVPVSAIPPVDSTASEAARTRQWREVGLGAQILKDLGLKKVRLLTNNPKKTDAFIYGGFDLTVVDQVPINPPINPHNEAYLRTKRDKLGHQLP